MPARKRPLQKVVGIQSDGRAVARLFPDVTRGILLASLQDQNLSTSAYYRPASVSLSF
jgi:hypothetical protein